MRVTRVTRVTPVTQITLVVPMAVVPGATRC